MANSRVLMPFILSKEGGYSNKKSDLGGPTNKGVTLTTYRSVFGKSKTLNDLKKISEAEWFTIYKRYYWDKCKGDDIQSQSVANMLVDFAWHSGVGRASRVVQKIVGTHQDGIIGTATLQKINTMVDLELFDKLKLERVKYLKSIAVGGQKVNLKGWMNRVSGIRYKLLVYDNKEIKC